MPLVEKATKKEQVHLPDSRKFSISSGKSDFTTIYWIPAFAGMTATYTQSSFPRRRESSSDYPDLLRSYEKT